MGEADIENVLGFFLIRILEVFISMDLSMIFDSFMTALDLESVSIPSLLACPCGNSLVSST